MPRWPDHFWSFSKSVSWKSPVCMVCLGAASSPTPAEGGRKCGAFRAFSSEVDTGSRKENASKQNLEQGHRGHLDAQVGIGETGFDARACRRIGRIDPGIV